VPLSIAAAMTSAGRSSCTPSEYVKASRGEYAGGSCCGKTLRFARATATGVEVEGNDCR